MSQNMSLFAPLAMLWCSVACVFGSFHRKLERLCRDNRGFANDVINVGVVIMIIVVVGIALAYFVQAMPSVADEQANATITSTFNIGWQALGILGIAVLIGAIVVIIRVLINSFGTGGR